MFRDAQLQDQFDRQGYVVLDLLNEQEVKELLAFWGTTDGGVRRLPFSTSGMSLDASYRRAAFRAVQQVQWPRVQEILRGYDMMMALMLHKPQGLHDSFIDMHQDWSFIDESRYEDVLCWCPLVDVDLLSGCLHVVPGSHKLNRNPRPALPGAQPFLYEHLRSVFSDYIVPLPMRAGQVVMYSGCLIHCSGPNITIKERPVSSVTALPAHLRPNLWVESEPGLLDRYEVNWELILDYRGPESVRNGTFIERVPRRLQPLTEDLVRATLEPARASTSQHATPLRVQL